MTTFEISPLNKMQYINMCLVHEWGAIFNAKSRIKKFEQSEISAQELLDAN